MNGLKLQILTKNSCRVCFIECSDAATNASEIATLFHNLVSYEILPSDPPQKICGQCLENLSVVQAFKETCDESEKVLQQLRQDHNVLKEETEVLVTKEEVIGESSCEAFPLEIVPEQVKDRTELLKHKTGETPVNPPTKMRRRSNFSWDYFALEEHLQENRIPVSNTHQFILKFDLNRPKPDQLPPNLDPETYEITETDETTLSCSYCSFKGIGALAGKAIASHCRRKCNKGNMFRCPCSFQAAYCLDQLRHHIKMKHPKRRVLYEPLQCNFCQFTCCYETTMERHCKKMHEKNVSELELCAECGETFYCEDLKLQHIVFRCNSGDESLQIPFKRIFGKAIPSLGTRSLQVLASMRESGQHEVDERRKRSLINTIYQHVKVICEVCGEEIYRKCLPKHMTKHENIRFGCDLCGKSYTEKLNLLKHMKAKHLGQNSYPCQYCDQVFRHWAGRFIHVKAKHTMDYAYACDLCDKRFIQACKLRDHRATHSDIRKFVCTECDAAFHNNLQLRNHRKYIHSTKAFPCPICSKNFKNRKLLRQHKNSHEPNKYICPVCPMSYSVGHSLRQHVTLKHPEYEMPPPGTIIVNKDINELKQNF